MMSSLPHGFSDKNSEMAISVDSSKNKQLPPGFSVLVVDADSTCLMIISKMLHMFGYKVVTAKRATDALCIAREREGEIHLVLTEVHFPDMDIYELLEKMGETSYLPVVIMSADDNENAMLGGLFKGAVFYLVKPITMNNIKNLWQYSFMKKRGGTAASEEVGSVQGAPLWDTVSDEDIESQSFVNQRKRNHQMFRMEGEEMDKDEEEDYYCLTVPKKPKLLWTNELHNRFLQAIRLLGIDSAHPKKILQYMNVPGLKKENISSHLQKYRQSLKREQDAIQKARIREIESSLGLFHPSLTSNLQGEYIHFPKLHSMATTFQPEFRSHFEKNPSSQISIPSIGSVHFSNQGASCHHDASNPKFEQLILLGNPQVSSHPDISHAGNSDVSGFNQLGNSSREGILQVNMAFSNARNSGSETTPHYQTLLTNSFEQQQQQQQLFPPPPPPPPQEQEEHDIFGKSGEIEELLDITKESSQLFHDEDFEDLW